RDLYAARSTQLHEGEQRGRLRGYGWHRLFFVLVLLPGLRRGDHDDEHVEHVHVDEHAGDHVEHVHVDQRAGDHVGHEHVDVDGRAGDHVEHEHIHVDQRAGDHVEHEHVYVDQRAGDHVVDVVEHEHVYVELHLVFVEHELVYVEHEHVYVELHLVFVEHELVYVDHDVDVEHDHHHLPDGALAQVHDGGRHDGLRRGGLLDPRGPAVLGRDRQHHCLLGRCDEDQCPRCLLPV